MQGNRLENNIKGYIVLNIVADKPSIIELIDNTESINLTYFKAFVSALIMIVEYNTVYIMVEESGIKLTCSGPED